jgi:hypothetical protein
MSKMMTAVRFQTEDLFYEITGFQVRKILGSQGGDYEECRILGYYAV